ncbi:unnamed protein product [Symbiodinium sp. CCMP2592]|nr:unnamed protein product [Symbiodinium sp. CCMP2592]
MEDEVIQVREVMATREREAVEAVHHAVCRTKAELEEPLRGSVEHLEAKADAAFDRVTRAEAESQEPSLLSGLGGMHEADFWRARKVALEESNRRAGEATAAAAAAVAERVRGPVFPTAVMRIGRIASVATKENATLHRVGNDQEISRLEQEGRGFQHEAARSSKQAETLRGELASQLAQLQTVQREAEDLARELELRSLPERRFDALDGEVQRLDGSDRNETDQRRRGAGLGGMWQESANSVASSNVEERESDLSDRKLCDAMDLNLAALLTKAADDDLPRGASRLAQTEPQVPETDPRELHQLQKELGTVTGELGASRARLEAAVAEKQVLEARLAEALQDVEEARKQREEKGWEAAEAAASSNREMARQRSESDEKYRLLEKEHSSVRDKLQSALSELAQEESQKKVLELQVETKSQQLSDLEARHERELAAQAEKLTVLDDMNVKAACSFGSRPVSAHTEDHESEQQIRLGQLQADLAHIMQQFQEVVLELKSLQSRVQEEKEATAAAESGFQESKSEIEATALACSALKQQLVAISDHFAKQRIEADAAQRGANKLETRVTAADGKRLEATFVPYSSDAGLQEVVQASEHEAGRQQCQLQKELGTVTGELGASRARLEAAVAEKQVLEARLAEALQDVEEARKQREEKGWEAAEAAASSNREMARQRSESDEKYRLLEKEHSSVRDKLQSALSELAQEESQKKVLELQVETKSQQLSDLEARHERELAAQAAKLEQMQGEVDRLTTELSKASQGSPAEEFKRVAEELRPRSQSENEGSEKDRKIQELQAQLDEVSQQLNQVQAELEQRSIEAAEALVDIGQDVDAIEWESGQRGRKLEAQIAEITEMEKDAEETVEALSEELDRCNAKLAASENKRKELEYHLEEKLCFMLAWSRMFCASVYRCRNGRGSCRILLQSLPASKMSWPSALLCKTNDVGTGLFAAFLRNHRISHSTSCRAGLCGGIHTASRVV